MKKTKRLNIAYGSNLNTMQMAYRCPTAKVYGKAILKGYQLLFKGSPQNAYATIEEKQDGEVPVLIWELKSEDEKALDRYEGYPDYYYKENVEVELENGETVNAFVYIMTDMINERIDLNFPSQRYLDIVTKGYLDAEFDIKYIINALEITKKDLYEASIVIK